MDIGEIIGACVAAAFFLCIPVLIIIGTVKTKRYTKKQIESGEDKKIVMNFASSIFKQPELYTFAVGNHIVTETRGRTTTYFYYSYLLAFNQQEFHIVGFKAVDHKPVYRNIITFDFANMQLTHKRGKKGLEIDLYMAGQRQHITVTDIVKGNNSDKSDTPYAIEQTREVQLLEQMLLQYEARSYQMQMSARPQ
ncbi:MAG: hypothetical protein IJP13_06650 [Lachnospiraceae bacterium]|nr:hypothetical protein [Lachnospiraceae bacterium]